MAAKTTTTRLAVFTKNHASYLEHARAIAKTDPARPVTFRAKRVWRQAQHALDKQGAVELYIAPVDGSGAVEYVALLEDVVLHPKRGEDDTERLLGLVLDETRDEGLWETEKTPVATLYSLSNCARLPTPIPMDSLLKAVDGSPLSKDYSYSYAVVRDMDIEDIFEDVRHPEELGVSEYEEGTTQRVVINRYERKAKARKECLHEHGTRCKVCGIDFGETYGDLGEGFIHVHHLRSLAEQKKKHRVDPRKDLVPVCPNCHAMIHHRDPPLTPAALRKLMKTASVK